MTSEKIKQVIQRYREYIYSYERVYYSENILSPVLHPTNELTEEYTESFGAELALINHVLWMCDAIDKMLIENKIGKAMRWLGFIQGVLWVIGFKTIDQMREDNGEEV